MSLWVDKYRPTQLNQLTINSDQATCLRQLVERDDFPHLLFYGPSGAGKKTRIHCLLRELYGTGTEQVRLETKAFTAPSGKKLEVQTVSSNYHIELTPSDVGIYDRVVVQEVVKQMAQTAQIDAATQKEFKVVVLMETDELTKDAQHALRRTMEKYSGNCRLILCCESLSRVIEPLRSRCMAIRVRSPTDKEIEGVVRDVCGKEGVSITEGKIRQLVEKSKGNLRRALLMLEASEASSQSDVVVPEWEVYVKETAKIIMQRMNADTLVTVRNRMYELISRCIPPQVIFVHLVYALLVHTPTHLKEEIVDTAAEYEHRLTKGSKAIFHLEAFVASFMHILSSSTKK